MVQDALLTPLGYEQFTSFDGAAVDLNPPPDATYALLQAEGDNVRWRDDGPDPTSVKGMIIVANDDIFYNGNINKIELIGVSANSILNVSYYK